MGLHLNSRCCGSSSAGLRSIRILELYPPPKGHWLVSCFDLRSLLDMDGGGITRNFFNYMVELVRVEKPHSQSQLSIYVS